MFLVFTPAFIAFIFTTFPRFSSTPTISKSIYIKILGLFAGGTLLFFSGAFFNTLLYIFGMIVIFIAHIWAVKTLYDIFNRSQMEDKHDIFWILLAFAFGIAAHSLFIAGTSLWLPLQHFAIQIGIYLYLFLVAFSVAQRMVPFFSHCMVERNEHFLKTVALLLAAHIILETIHVHLSFIADFVLTYIIAKELFRWNLPFPNPNPLLWILHVSLLWIPVAFLFGAMSNTISLLKGTTFLFLDIHTLMLGFVFTILIGFGTRVTLGHSGNMMQAGIWEKFLFNWTQVVVIVRLLVSMAAAWNWNFMPLFNISAAVWLTMFALWTLRFFPLLTHGKKLS
jgi:uncharacterized protein involved in response to NO